MRRSRHERQTHISVVFIIFVVFPTIMFAALPGLTQEGSAISQEGSAGGQADVPAVVALDLGPFVAEAMPDSEAPAPPRGLTEEGIAAKQRAHRGVIERTTKAVVMEDTEPWEPNRHNGGSLPGAAAPVLGISFPGVTDTGQFPPDPTIAAGPANLVVATNGIVNTFSKDGILLASQTLAGFFGGLGQPATDGPFDPWLAFDPYIDRFWLVAVSRNVPGRRSSLLVALSNSNDAMGGWSLFALDARLNGNRNSGFWCDYPKLGTDAQAVYLTCNMFDFRSRPRFRYAKVRVITKAQFINNTCCLWWDRWNLREGRFNLFKSFTVQPALMHGATVADGIFLINAGGRGGRGNQLIIRRVTNAQRCCIPGNQRSPNFRKRSLKVGRYSSPPDATQLGTSTRIDTGDTRLLYAFWKEGLLSTGQNLACRSRACLGVTELDVSRYPAARVISDFAHTVPALHLYYPQVAVNAGGNKTMVFSASNVNQFADARYTGIPPSSVCRNCTDGPHTIIQAGQNSYVRLDNRRRNRWGDYSGASPDPDGIGIWIHGEFADAAQNTWGTWVALTQRTRDRPDLLPVGQEPEPFPFCRGNQAVVRVRNAGGIVAPGSITTVDFGGFGSVDVATPEVPADSFVDLTPITPPPRCFDPDCGFRISVDSQNSVDEGADGEANNTASGQCLG